MQNRYKVALFLILLLPIVSTTGALEVSSTGPIQSEIFQVSQTPDAVYIAEVPYVWQEVNGYCMSAALSMVLQSMDMDLNLHDLFAAMGTGFSAVYIGIDEARMFLPGVLIRQPEYFQFFCDLYGLEFSTYIDIREPFGSEGAFNYDRLGIDYIDYQNSSLETQFDIIRETISSGYPLAIAADLYYLPPEDYDDFRRYGSPLEAGGVAHAITVVGYNDTSEEVYIQDPGVGLWEDNYGYPDDGRWNYTMSYFTFNRAWKNAGYIAFKVTPGTGPVDDFEERLGEYLVERLRGDRSGYFEEYENFYYLSPGKSAFNGLGLDLTVDCIAEYARWFKEVDKDEALLSLGHITEMFLTMQYHGFNNALDAIQDIFPDVDLSDFIDAADDALPHYDALTSNAAIRGTVGAISRDTLLFSTFEDIAEDFQNSGNLEGSIGNHQDRLDEIREHLFAIANSWNVAADALEIALDLGGEPELLEGSTLVVIAGAGVMILVVAICIIRRRK